MTTQDTSKALGLGGWTNAVVRRFHAGLTRETDSHAVITVTLDPECVEVFDGRLSEMRRSDDRLPHHKNERTLLRSAAIEVLVEAYLDARKHPMLPSPSREMPNADDALTGSLERVLYSGLVERLSQDGRQRLVVVDCLIAPATAEGLDRELAEVMGTQVPDDERAAWTAEAFDDLRSALIEACILTSLIWEGVITEESVPALNAAVDARQPRRRRQRPYRRR